MQILLVRISKSNLLPSFSERYIQDLSDDLEYTNILKKHEYKKNRTILM